ncbi:hypothetical protein HPP92_028069 [Vanilla planifolia]|uniref:Bifunctional inhibitor/plant lipid transfer protein/seed storage helical domain-containing protein n=1 Tax=Vanilla planifolia TaxID=51239 RepID=A0A835U4Z5_VANPL|nr:hypothetical protein HPP92_028069 [Vanilla planifolia]KAG0448045.1 hypothetical protein HPP92_028040 [Vanilla planifolia]
MAPKSTKRMFAILFILNTLFFTFTSSCHTCPKPKPPPPPKGSGANCPPPPKIKPTPTPSGGKCPVDVLKLGVCVDVLKGLLNLTIGQPPKTPCCSLLGGIADAEAALCLCTVLKADIIGIILDIPIDLSLLLNYCGKKAPKGFQCP